MLREDIQTLRESSTSETYLPGIDDSNQECLLKRLGIALKNTDTALEFVDNVEQTPAVVRHCRSHAAD